MTPLSVAAYAGRIGRTPAFRPKPVAAIASKVIDKPTETVAPQPPQMLPPTIEEMIRAAVAAHMKSIATPAVVRSGRIVPSVDLIMRETALAYGVPQHTIKSHDRRVHETKIRQVFYYLARELSGQSLPEIGRRCGGRDHTTILHGVNVIKAALATDAGLAAQIDIIKSRVNKVVQRSTANSTGGLDAGRTW